MKKGNFAIIFLAAAILGGCGEGAGQIGQIEQIKLPSVEGTQDGTAQDGMLQDRISQDGVTQGNISQDNMFQDNMSQGNMSQGNMSEDNMPLGSASQNGALQAYISLLEDVYTKQIFPDGKDYGYQSWESEKGDVIDVTSNQFAVYDIDHDGKDELIIQYTTTYMAGMLEAIYAYNENTGTIVPEILEFPMLTFYDNGAIEAGWSHNQGLAGYGDFWPYNLYQYDKETDSYVMVAMVDAWNKAQTDKDYNGNPFPDEVDADGDGFVYYIMTGEYELETPVDGAAYNQWRETYIKGANVVEIPYQRLTKENIYGIAGLDVSQGNNADTGILKGQIIEQSFDVTLDGWGEVTFAAFEPEYESVEGNNGLMYGDGRYMLLKDGRVIYIFPGYNEDNTLYFQRFLQVASVAFRDYNEDGRMDILLIIEYVYVGDDKTPYREARAYTQEEGKEFVIDVPVTKYLMNYADSMEEMYKGLENYAQSYSVCTSKTAWEVERYARKVKKMILTGDFSGLSQEINYPITVDGITYKDSGEFLKADFIADINPEVVLELEEEFCGQMFASWQGIMLGNGSVWIGESLNEDLSSRGLKVSALNGFTSNY